MRSLPPVRNQLRIRFRYLLWRQDFHLVGEVQVENSHPHGKTCSHNSKTPAWNQLRNRCLHVLWRQDFHRVEGMCKLKTRTHGMKTCTHGMKTCTHKRMRGTAPSAQAFSPTDSAEEPQLLERPSALGRFGGWPSKKIPVYRRRGAVSERTAEMSAANSDC